MWSVDRPPRWVGRERELAILRAGVEALSRGEGSVIWVEGEPGIGKSSLVAEALAAGGDPRWNVGWGIAGTLTQRLPLRVMLDCLQVRLASPDPRRAHAASLLRGFQQGLYADGDTSASGIEVLEALVDELCASAPTVIVLDDLQWADEASLIVWHQLAASIGQLPLLLVGTCRPTPVRPEVRELRAAVARLGGAVVTLGPLPETDVAALVTAMLGSPPGDALRGLTAQAVGNPLYVRELIDALVRERAVEIGPAAELSITGGQLPASLAAVLNDRLSSVSAVAAQMLRTGALLGPTFAVTDLAVVLRQTASDLVVGIEDAGDKFAMAHALTDLWLISSIRRDHVAALDHVNRALSMLGDDPAHADLRSFALDGRIFTLQNLDRWPQAELTLRQARETARRGGNPDHGTWGIAAVLRYWLGQWDDALAELGPDDANAPGLIYTFLRERWSSLLWHGVSALIAGRRDERATAAPLLRRGLALPIQVISDRENQDFLVAAHALALEQSGDTHQAMLRLATMLARRDGEMTLIHQWLPDLVRLALAVGDQSMAQAAVQACRAEAAAETWPARAAAASLRCQGLLDADPDPLQEAVARYRAAGSAVELPVALEDLAVVLAARGRDEDARGALNEAIGLYEGLQAHWDIRRAEARLRPHGIRRGVRGPRGQRANFGWEALTPTELKIATLVARGDSTSDIAGSMFLSRRTVQTYISRILGKLGAKGRVDIVREALRQGVSP